MGTLLPENRSSTLLQAELGQELSPNKSSLS